MPGPTRRKTATSNRANPLQPPRPPNAWILYRSDKLKEIPPPAPGERPPRQADMSKITSAMWKRASPDVRAQYEHLSEIKKAEHREKYPDYRFQPVKRQDKGRLHAKKQAEKEKKRKGKGRARSPNSRPPPPLFTTDARLPTASGASTSGTRAPSTQSGPIPEAGPSSQPGPSRTVPSPLFDQPATSGAHTPDPFPLTPAPSVEPFSIASEGALFPGAWPSIDYQRLEESLLNVTDFWDFETSELQEYLALPAPPPPSASGWGADESDLFDDGMRETEVTMHNVDNANASANYDQFGNFGFLFGDNGVSNSLYTPSTTSGVTEELSFFNEGMSYDTLSMPQSSGPGMEFGNYSFDNSLQDAPLLAADATEEEVVTPERAAGIPSPADYFSPMTYPVPAPYMPPMGATNSSTRRVAADWRHVRAPSPEPQPLQDAATTWWL